MTDIGETGSDSGADSDSDGTTVKQKQKPPDSSVAVHKYAKQQERQLKKAASKAFDTIDLIGSSAVSLKALTNVETTRKKQRARANKKLKAAKEVGQDVLPIIDSDLLADARQRLAMPLSTYRFKDEVLEVVDRLQRPLDQSKVQLIFQQMCFNPHHLIAPGAVVYIGHPEEIEHLTSGGNLFKRAPTQEEIDNFTPIVGRVDEFASSLRGKFVIQGGQHNYSARKLVEAMPRDAHKARIQSAKPHFEAYMWCIPPVSHLPSRAFLISNIDSFLAPSVWSVAI